MTDNIFFLNRDGAGTLFPPPRRKRTGQCLRRLFPVLALCLLCLAAGCGKKGMPQPADTSKSFQWKEVQAKAVGNCMAFTGSFSGAYRNFDGVRLEIAGVNGPEDCPGCPFVPKEVVELSPAEAGFDKDKGTIAFSYCPIKAKAQRWRIAGISVYNRLPHTVSLEQMLVMEK